MLTPALRAHLAHLRDRLVVLLAVFALGVLAGELHGRFVGYRNGYRASWDPAFGPPDWYDAEGVPHWDRDAEGGGR